MAEQTPPALRVTLRLDVAGKATLGPGKVRLLELIGEHGSISAAGRAMGMSYRRAWLLVEALNTSFTGPLVAARPGGANGGGAVLLPMGQEVVRHYRALEAGTAIQGGGALNALGALIGRDG
jgi:molybdate transport system regulatory protein